MKVVMFPNNFKDNDKKPDYVLYISKDREDSGNQQEKAPEENKNTEIPDSLV